MEQLERENALLRQRIAELEARQLPVALEESDITSPFERVSSLTNAEIFRFGRQLVVPGFGLECKYSLPLINHLNLPFKKSSNKIT